MSTMTFEFAEPWLLLLILALLPVFWLTKDSGAKISYSSIATLKAIRARTPFHPRQILKILRFLALILIIIALARPQSGKHFSKTDSEGVDILLALDTSGSMKALDFKINNQPTSRLEVVKNVVADFIKKREQDRMGLIVFGEEAFIQCPLTLDHGILLDFLKEIEIGMAGDATAIGSALGIVTNRMKELKAKSKIAILLTDGRSNAGRLSPQKAAEIAKTFGIKVYTIGVGTKGKAPFLVDTIFGKKYAYEDVDIDEDGLKQIAQETGARYFRATDTENLAQIYDEIDKLEKTEIKVKKYTEYNEMFHWPLLLAILLLLAELVLSRTLLRKIP